MQLNTLIVYQLDNYQSAAIFGRQQDFATLGQLYKFAYLNLSLGLFGDVPHVRQTTVD